MKNEMIMSDEHNDELIGKVLGNAASEADASRVARWFSTDEGQEYLSSRMSADFENMSGEDQSPEPDDESFERMRRRLLDGICGERRRRFRIIAAASIAVPFVLLLSSLVYIAVRTDILSPVRYASVEVPVGERTRVILADGTSVVLNSMSRLTYPTRFGFSKRQVTLEGEAYFDVSKDSGRPFTVLTDAVDVRVTGTRFNVKAYSQEPIKVALDEGAVALDDHHLLKYDLKPGECAEYDRLTRNCRVIRPSDMSVFSSWKDNTQSFSMAHLGEILCVLERQYGVAFEILEDTVLDSRFTLSFSNKTPVEDVLADIESVSTVVFRKNGDVGWQVLAAAAR